MENNIKTARKDKQRTKRFLYRELAELYDVNPRTVSRLVSGFDLRRSVGAIRAVLLMESRYGPLEVE